MGKAVCGCRGKQASSGMLKLSYSRLWAKDLVKKGAAWVQKVVQSCSATSHRTDRRFCCRTGHAGAEFLPWEWGAHGGERGGLQLSRSPQVGSQMDSVVLQGSWERPDGFILHGARVQLVLRVRKNPGDFFALF